MPRTAIFTQLTAHFEAHANPANAGPMAAYMRHQFPFLGIKATERAALAKSFFKQHGPLPIEAWPPLCLDCFEEGVPRELQYLPNDVLNPTGLKRIDATWLPLIEQLICTLSWWDTVDWLSPHFAGAIFRKSPQLRRPTCERWIASDNFWLQRSAILCQLKAKNDTDEDLLFDMILARADSKEFFVQKAAGWALREYSKRHPHRVSWFLNQYEVSHLTRREGSKYVD